MVFLGKSFMVHLSRMTDDVFHPAMNAIRLLKLFNAYKHCAQSEKTQTMKFSSQRINSGRGGTATHLGDVDDLGHHADAVPEQLDLDDHGRHPAGDHVEAPHKCQHVGRQVLQLGIVPRLLQQLLVLSMPRSHR